MDSRFKDCDIFHPMPIRGLAMTDDDHANCEEPPKRAIILIKRTAHMLPLDGIVLVFALQSRVGTREDRREPPDSTNRANRGNGANRTN